MLTVIRIRKPLAVLVVLLQFLTWAAPAVAQEPGAQASQSSGRPASLSPVGQRSRTPSTPAGEAAPGSQGGAGAVPMQSEATSGEPGVAADRSLTIQSFQNDLFTGAATAEIPIVLPPGTAGTAPKVTLRYNSSSTDDLKPREQGSGVGLGWLLDAGGYILRDTKGTTATSPT